MGTVPLEIRRNWVKSKSPDKKKIPKAFDMIQKNKFKAELRDAERAVDDLASATLEKAEKLYVIGSSLWASGKTLISAPYKGIIDDGLACGASYIPFEQPPVKQCDCVVVIGSKQKEETEEWVDRALRSLKSGGMLIVALENEQGGKSLDKRLKLLGLDYTVETKCKSRVFIALAPNRAAPLFEYNLNQRADGLWTKAGVFSWKKQDVGTTAFLEILDKSAIKLSGKGADFGAGIGDISRHVLARHQGINNLMLIEHDSRALECARRNLEDVQARTEFLWADIPLDPLPKAFDFILMNPPFHVGKESSADLGLAFIKKAANSLKKQGELFMVANVHLPYEKSLRERFETVESLGVLNGFKVLQAKAPKS